MPDASSQAAKALVQSRDEAVRRCKSLRPAQARARASRAAAEINLNTAQEACRMVTDQIGQEMAEMKNLEKCYQQLTGQPMAPRPDVY